MGDEVQRIANDKSLMLINHQSTSDVPLIMAALDGQSRKIMWIMDRMFMKTNFGIVSWFHKDFFISSVIVVATHRTLQFSMNHLLRNYYFFITGKSLPRAIASGLNDPFKRGLLTVRADLDPLISRGWFLAEAA